MKNQSSITINESIDEIEPTDQEIESLPHVSDKIPVNVWLIILSQFAYGFAYYGLNGQFQNYIQFPVPVHNDGHHQPGALNKGQTVATSVTTFFRFCSALTSMVGAIVADQYMGKYKTIIICCFIYIIGLLILLLTSIPQSISIGLGMPGLIIAMLFLGLGTGGIRSNISSLMAEQYTRKKPFKKVSKRNVEVIVSPSITTESMFHYFYLVVSVGSLASILATLIEKYHSFWLSYLIPFVVFFITIIVLLTGRHRYVKIPPTGSLLVKSFNAIRTAFVLRRKYGKTLPPMASLLDYSKPSMYTTTKENFNWDDTFIENLKQAFNASKIFLFFPIYTLCTNQIHGNLISQAAQMNTGPLSNDVINNIDPLITILLVPIFNKALYPMLRKMKINFHSILRITIGFYMVSIAMAWTAFVQSKIYQTNPDFNFSNPSNNLNAAWQIPSYCFTALSHIFASISALEYAYVKAPSTMKSVVTSAYFITHALSSAMGFILLPVTVNPKLTWMYTALACVAFIAGTLFFVCFQPRNAVVHVKEVEVPVAIEQEKEKQVTFRTLSFVED
ncbi:unnamed protein product [Adineta steineri]|uniref:Uncharacterized protein n=1 Tax=Adineta steineri TaxID=433720 RepID=A0A819XQ83_9BILA|nr:unnamed protein product [Adineta steineri]CAF1497418.1 unnamed protein product [Adineta steineri]CAF3632189.1 unnamed protein product [Adineta steineri]CAF4144992.1 unnamed protein product [Adineta steineri]